MLNVWQPSLRVCGIKVRSGWIAPTAAGWSKNLMVAPSFAHPTMSEATRIASGEAEIGCVVPTYFNPAATSGGTFPTRSPVTGGT
jgi:hypothetical protein